MAYPTVDGPYGLIPINLIGGQANPGALRQIKIASAYNTSIFFGDIVTLVADGSVELDAGTATATPVGVFMGCSYTDPGQDQPIFRQYFPADTVASDIVAFVCDDPDMLFKVAVVSGTTVMSSVGRTAIGANLTLVQNAGDTATGKSKVAVDDTPATTNTLPIRCVDVVPDTATGADAFVEVIVKWNAGMHQYNNATGTA